MQENPFFSIVMPVYNVEKYLTQAVQSVLNQTYENFELLLIDDCSTDSSAQLCEALANKDARVHLMMLPTNGGVSNARNIGADAASGEYLMFMDSDDTVAETLLADVYSALQENAAQVVVFGMQEDLYNSNGVLLSEKPVVTDSHSFQNAADLRAYILDLEKSTLYGYACNKFYKLSYLREIQLRYEEAALLEDLFFNVAYFQNISSLVVLDKPYYRYRRVLDTHSRTAKFVPDYYALHMKKIRLLQEQQMRWEQYDDSAKTMLAQLFSRYTFSALERNCNPQAHMCVKQRITWLKTVFSGELYLSLRDYLSVGASLQGILNIFFKNKCSFMCCAVARFIYFVKTTMPALFDKMK